MVCSPGQSRMGQDSHPSRNSDCTQDNGFEDKVATFYPEYFTISRGKVSPGLHTQEKGRQYREVWQEESEGWMIGRLGALASCPLRSRKTACFSWGNNSCTQSKVPVQDDYSAVTPTGYQKWRGNRQCRPDLRMKEQSGTSTKQHLSTRSPRAPAQKHACCCLKGLYLPTGLILSGELRKASQTNRHAFFPLNVHTALFTHSSADGHWGCFQFGVLMNRDAVSIWHRPTYAHLHLC